MTKKKVSVVIPAFNEENSIKDTIINAISVCKKNFEDFEVVAVNDGSTDKTGEILLSIKDPHLKGINRKFNRGYGATLKEGINYACGEIIVIIDADGTYPVEEIPKLVEGVEQGCDMCVAARRGRYRNVPLFKALAKFTLDRTANLVAGKKIPDINSGLRAFKKEDVLKFFGIISNGFSFTTTITLAYLSNGYLISYIPIEYKDRVGSSKVKAKDAFEFLSLIIRTIMYFNPLRIFVPPAFILMFLGVAKFLFDLFNEPTLNITESAVFLFLSGLQILAIGMLADLIRVS